MPPKGKKRQRRPSKQAQEEASEVDPREEEEVNEEESTQTRGKAKKTRTTRKQSEDEAEPMDVDEGGDEGGESQESGSSSQHVPASTDEQVLREVDHMLEDAEQDGRRILGLPSSAPLFPTHERPTRVHETEEIGASSTRGRRRSTAPPPRQSTGGRRGSIAPEPEEEEEEEAHPPSTDEQRRQQLWSKEAHGAIVEAANRRGSKGKGKAAPPPTTATVAPTSPAQPASRHTSPSKSPRKILSEEERKRRAEAAKASSAGFAGPFTLPLRLLILALVGMVILRAIMAPVSRLPFFPLPPGAEELERARARQRAADDAVLARFEAELLTAMDQRAAEALEALDEKMMQEASKEVQALQARAKLIMQAMKQMAETVEGVAQDAQQLGDKVEEGARRREALGQQGVGEEEEEELEALRDELGVLSRRMHELRFEAEQLGPSTPPPTTAEASAGHSKLRKGAAASAPASPPAAAVEEPPSEAEAEVLASLKSLRESFAQGPLASLRTLTAEVLPTLNQQLRQLQDLDIEIVAPLPPKTAQPEEGGKVDVEAVVRLVEEGWAIESEKQRVTIKESRAVVEEGLVDTHGEESEGEEGGSWINDLQAQLEDGLDALRAAKETQAQARDLATAEASRPKAAADEEEEESDPEDDASLPSAEWVEAKVDRALRARLPLLTHAGAGAPDFASARGGAHINRRKGMTSRPIDNRRPEFAISDSFQLGDCYPLPIPGKITVRLSRPIVPQSFGLSHISSSQATAHGTRPSEVRLYGYPDAAAFSDPIPLGDTFVWDGSALHHTFDLPLDASQGQPIRAVTLEVLNNTGDPHHACLYRFRMHGSPIPLPRDSSLACHLKSRVLGEDLECAENAHLNRVAQEVKRVEALPWVQQLQDQCGPLVQTAKQALTALSPWMQHAKESLTALVHK